MPETCADSASTYAAYGVTSAVTVSSTGSAVRRRISDTPAATTAPMPAPPPAASRKSSPARPHGTVPPTTANAVATRNRTRLVASLNRLSAWISACSRGGSGSRRPSAVTATGSVLASTVPRTKAIGVDSGVSATATPATAAAEARTRPSASTVTGRHTGLSSGPGRSCPAAYSSGGRTTTETTFGEICTAGTPGIIAIASPARTSRDGAGTRSRCAEAATAVASTTSNRTISTLRIGTLSARQCCCRPDFPARHRHLSRYGCWKVAVSQMRWSRYVRTLATYWSPAPVCHRPLNQRPTQPQASPAAYGRPRSTVLSQPSYPSKQVRQIAYPRSAFIAVEPAMPGHPDFSYG